MMVHQVDMERFTFLFLCGKRDRRILQGKEKMKWYADWIRNQISELKVEVRLNTQPTVEQQICWTVQRTVSAAAAVI